MARHRGPGLASSDGTRVDGPHGRPGPARGALVTVDVGPDGSVWASLRDVDGEIGAVNVGLGRLKNGTWTVFSEEDGLPSRHVYSVDFDGQATPG